MTLLDGRPAPAPTRRGAPPPWLLGSAGLLGLLAAFGPLSIDMYLSSLPAIGVELGGGMDGAQLTLAAFFAGTDWRSNFLVNLGYGDPTGLFDRSPRLSFDEACRLE